MFTGIIENLAVVKSLTKKNTGAILIIESKACASGTRPGDSISINGACLTVIGLRKNMLSFEVSKETLARTGIGKLKIDECVNTERSLKLGSRMGGHFVTGHIDCTAKIISKKNKGEFVELEISIPEEFKRYLAEKGSISVDGISLTINRIQDDGFSVVLIPYTLSHTTLGFKKEGNIVNIELDILAKYTYNQIAKKNIHNSAKKSASHITPNFLRDHGFL
jgi:riboflavin synthase